MAEVTGLRNNALPYPIYGVPFGIVFPYFDADGDLVSAATTPDSEVSLNGDTFADCTNEATEIATTSGMWYLLLTAAEVTADVVAIISKSATSGMKTTPIVLYPRKLVTIRSGTSAGGAAGYITLDASASAVDDYYNGMVCIATIDTNVEVRVISDYTGSSKQAAVVPNWNVVPDADDTFIIKLPEGVQINQANATHVNSTAQTAGDLAALVTTVDDFLDTEVAAILADTNELQIDWVDGGRLDLILDARASQTSVDTIDNFLDTEIGSPSDFGSGASLAKNLVDIEAQTDDIGALGAGLTAVPWNATWDAEVQSEVDDALDTIVADSVPADGTRPTFEQALYMIVQFLTERAVSGTTLTVKKVDGSTTLFTETLNDDTTPTSITRAS